VVETRERSLTIRVQRGQAIIEYVVILALIVAIVVVLLGQIGKSTASTLCRVNHGLGGQCTAYVTAFDNNTVTPIDLTTTPNRAGTVIPSVTNAYGIAIAPDGKSAYVVNTNGFVTVIDVSTNTVRTTISGMGHPLWIAITPDGKTAYVDNDLPSPGNVYVLDLTTNALKTGITNPITVANAPQMIAITPDGKSVYVANQGSSSVTVIDVASNTVKTTISGAGIGPQGIAITPDGKTAYVTDHGTDTVTVIDVGSNTVRSGAGLPINLTLAGNNPYGIAITPDGKTAFVACEGGAVNGTVTVLDLTANPPVLKTGFTNPILGFNSPTAVAITPDGTTAYVTNSDTVAPGPGVIPITVATSTVGSAIIAGSNSYGIAIF
jgi:YVTN family beta-propeller protein